MIAAMSRRRLRGPIGQVANLFRNDGKARVPASPARAASIDALSDSRLVRSAMTLMVSTIELISLVRFPISFITDDDCAIVSRRRPIPWIERWTDAPPSSASCADAPPDLVGASRHARHRLDRALHLRRRCRGRRRGVGNLPGVLRHAVHRPRRLIDGRRVLLDHRRQVLAHRARPASIDAAISLIDEAVSSAAAARSSALPETDFTDAVICVSDADVCSIDVVTLSASLADAPNRRRHLVDRGGHFLSGGRHLAGGRRSRSESTLTSPASTSRFARWRTPRGSRPDDTCSIDAAISVMPETSSSVEDADGLGLHGGLACSETGHPGQAGHGIGQRAELLFRALRDLAGHQGNRVRGVGDLLRVGQHQRWVELAVPVTSRCRCVERFCVAMTVSRPLMPPVSVRPSRAALRDRE